jgi:TRAP-type C4-dicarboxylate transport system permease small subunit
LSDPQPNSWWARVATLGRTVETALLVILLSGLIVFASAQILLRNVFSIGVNWGDGLIRLTVFWLALLGALAASRDGKHITMEALGHWLPPRAQHIGAICADLFAAGFCAAFAWFALAFVRDSRTYGDTLLDGVPAWWLQSIMPVAFALIACRYFARAASRTMGR